MKSSVGYHIFISLNMQFMVLWKVAGELVSLKNMTCGSKSPFGVLKAAFHSSPSLIWILLYPHHMSNLVKRLFVIDLTNKGSSSDDEEL